MTSFFENGVTKNVRRRFGGVTSLDRKPHDRLVKAAFRRVAGARALLMLALPEAVRKQLDFDDLRLVSGDLIGSRLRESLTDLLYSIGDDANPVLVHALVEHKSRSERFTILQLLTSSADLWSAYRRENPLARRIPRILPIVVHHGFGRRRPWTAPTTLPELFAGGPGLAHACAPFDPRFPIVVIDLTSIEDERILGVAAIDPFAAAALWALKWSRAVDFLTRLTAQPFVLEFMLRPGRLGAERPDAESLLDYAVMVGASTLDYDEFVRRLQQHLPAVETEDFMKTLGQELIERGKIEGKIEGQLQALRKFLSVRFGPLPPDLDRKLEISAHPTVLDRLTALAASARSLTEFERELA